jgi:hypothetical protein
MNANTDFRACLGGKCQCKDANSRAWGKAQLEHLPRKHYEAHYGKKKKKKPIYLSSQDVLYSEIISPSVSFILYYLMVTMYGSLICYLSKEKFKSSILAPKIFLNLLRNPNIKASAIQQNISQQWICFRVLLFLATRGYSELQMWLE